MVKEVNDLIGKMSVAIQELDEAFAFYVEKLKALKMVSEQISKEVEILSSKPHIALEDFEIDG